MSDKYRQTVVQSIPGIPNDCPVSLSPLLDAVKVNLETGIGVRTKTTGINFDQWVRIRDLTDQDFWKRIGSPINDLFTPISGADSTPPGEPTNFTVTQGVWVNFLSWTNPADEDFSYVEVWGGQVDDVTQATILANVSYPASSWAHPLYNEFEQGWFYWVRAVDFYGNKSGFVGTGTGEGGIPAPGDTSIGDIIDEVMDALKGYQAEFSIYSASTRYYYGDRVIYAGSDGVDRTYKCVVGGGGSIINIAPLTSLGKPRPTYWLRSGILVEGDVDGIATVGIDGNAVIDGTLLARSIKTDQLIVGDNISIQDGSIYIAALATETANLINGKTKTFFQASIPTSTAIGDTWFDSDDNNKEYRAAMVGANEIKAGEWVSVQDAGAARGLLGLSASGQITKIVQASLFQAAYVPPASGLWMTAENIGYYNLSTASWPVYIRNDGSFWFGKDSNNYFAYSGGNLVFRVGNGGAFYFLDGADISMLATGTDPSKLKWGGGTLSNEITMAYDISDGGLSIWESLGSGGTFNIGANLSGVDRFRYIRLYGTDIVINSTNGTSFTGGITTTGNLVIQNTAPIIDLLDTTANHHWYILNDGDSLQFRYNSLSANRMNLSSAGVLSLDSTLVENAWSIDMDRKGERGAADDVWEMARSIRDAFTQHDGRLLHVKLKKESVNADKSVSYGKSPSDLIQVLTECVMDLYEEVFKNKSAATDPK